MFSETLVTVRGGYLLKRRKLFGLRRLCGNHQSAIMLGCFSQSGAKPKSSVAWLIPIFPRFSLAACFPF